MLALGLQVVVFFLLVGEDVLAEHDPCSEARYICELGLSTSHAALPDLVAARLKAHGTLNEGGWRVVPRSASARSFPTDFALVALDDDAVTTILPALQRAFVRVTRDHCHHGRKLQFGRNVTMEEAMAKKKRKRGRGQRRRRAAASRDTKAPPPGGRPLRRNDRRDGLMQREVDVDVEAASGSQRRRPPLQPHHGRRSLLGIALPPGHNLSLPPIAEYLQADLLWAQKGGLAEGVKVAVFDSGVNKSHPNLHQVGSSIDFTNEATTVDIVGHGTFISTLIAGLDPACRGLAPGANILMYRVFTNAMVTFTSWLLDAFNHAIWRGVDVIDFTIGSPDYLDMPFLEKLWEVSANGIVVVSAAGNDGPLYGTHNNPADMSSVISVGGIEWDNMTAPFSSRGYTTWEIREGTGAGRVKPDLVANARYVLGNTPLICARGKPCVIKCVKHWGNSVSSTIVTAAAALLVGGIPKSERKRLVNVASIKQALISTAIRLPTQTFTASQIANNLKATQNNIVEQGAGRLNLPAAFKFFTTTPPHASAFPSTLNLTDCPYMWPYCVQPLYAHAMPTIINVTILNGMGVWGQIRGSTPCQWRGKVNGEMLRVSCTVSRQLWPYVGWIAIYLTIPHEFAMTTATVEGTIVVLVTSPSAEASPSASAGPQFREAQTSLVRIPLTVAIIPTPPREKRLLWDQWHNLAYPPGYIPRDSLAVFGDQLDWNGDHLHTNFRGLFHILHAAGYYLEILYGSYTCFDADQYAVLLMVDVEEDFYAEEMVKLRNDVERKGLSLVILAEWFNAKFIKKAAYVDVATRSEWKAITGGANLPAINELLEPFGCALGNRVYRGQINLRGSDKSWDYASGTSLALWPRGGKILLAKAPFVDSTATVLFDGHEPKADNVPILGLLQVATPIDDPDGIFGFRKQSGQRPGRVVVYGDSNCVDSAHMTGPCWWLFEQLVAYAITGVIDVELEAGLDELHAQLKATYVELPVRSKALKFERFSKVGRFGKEGANATCRKFWPFRNVPLQFFN